MHWLWRKKCWFSQKEGSEGETRKGRKGKPNGRCGKQNRRSCRCGRGHCSLALFLCAVHSSVTLTVIGRDCTGRREECGSRRGAAPHCPLRQPSSPTWRLPGTPVSLGTLNVPPELHLHYRRLKFLLYQGSWCRRQTGLRDHHRGVTSPHTWGGGDAGVRAPGTTDRASCGLQFLGVVRAQSYRSA